VDMVLSAHTLDRCFVHRSTKARLRNDNAEAESSSEVPDVRQGYANTGAALPIRSADVRPRSDEDADVTTNKKEIRRPHPMVIRRQRLLID